MPEADVTPAPVPDDSGGDIRQPATPTGMRLSIKGLTPLSDVGTPDADLYVADEFDSALQLDLSPESNGSITEGFDHPDAGTHVGWVSRSSPWA